MYKRFSELLQEKQLSTYRVSKDTGISQQTLSDWKLGRSTPKLNKLQKLADYFGVSVEYFTDNSEKENDPPPVNEREIANNFVNLLTAAEWEQYLAVCNAMFPKKFKALKAMFPDKFKE